MVAKCSKRVQVPKYRLHKGSGQGFIQIRGRRYYLGVYGSEESLTRYKQVLGELVVSPAVPKTIAPADGQTVLVVQVAAGYWEHCQAYYQKDGEPTGHLHAVSRALHYVRQLYAHVPVVEFGPLALRAIQQHLVNEGRCRTTINQWVGIIKRAFKWAASVEMIPVTVHQALATVPGLKRGRTTAAEPTPVRPVDDSVVDATTPHLAGVVADMVRFQRLTGCRPEEVCQVRPCDVDRTGDVWTYRPQSHKTEHHGRERIICLGPQSQALLRPYLLRPADAHCFSPIEAEDRRHAAQREARKSKVQPSQRNRRKARPARAPKPFYVKDSYARAIRRGIEKANKQVAKQAAEQGVEPPVPIPHWHPSQLRHTRATEIRREFGLEAAQVTLGHSKADVTQVYAERDQRLAADVARKIG
jgi:integrase